MQTELELQKLIPQNGLETTTNVGSLTLDTKVMTADETTSIFKKADKNFESIVQTFKSLPDMPETSDYSNEINFLMNTRDIIGQMVVSQLSTWYYTEDEQLLVYQTLTEALAANEDFSGKVNYIEDVKLTGDALELKGRKLTIDLQGHSLSCNRASLIKLNFGSDLTIQNGAIYVPRIAADETAEHKFIVKKAKLLLKNISLDCDGYMNQSIWQYRVFNVTQDLDEMLDGIGHSDIEFDKDCSIRFHDCNQGECLVCSIAPYNELSSAWLQLKENPEFAAKYATSADYQADIRPSITVDCDIRISKSLSADTGSYPGFIAGTGLDFIETVINIETNAKIFSDEHGIYLGNNGIININGPALIVAGTGICMRSGKLNIPKGANPTIIGTAEPKFVEIGTGLSGYYDPLHTAKHNADWGTNLRLGHAICLESNGTNYGKHNAEADIQSGNLISYSNTAIGAYGLATNWLPSLEYRAVDSAGNALSAKIDGKTYYFYKRPSAFASGIQSNRREAQAEYDYVTGANPDYKTASGAEPSLNAVKFEKGHKADLTNMAGVTTAVKDLLILLGDAEENIIS